MLLVKTMVSMQLQLKTGLIRLVLANVFASLFRRQGDTPYQHAVRHAAFELEQADMIVQSGSVQGIQAILLLAQHAMLDQFTSTAGISLKQPLGPW